MIYECGLFKQMHTNRRPENKEINEERKINLFIDYYHCPCNACLQYLQ